MISICIATRNRPDLFKRVCLSLLNNALNPNDIEFIIYRDKDDESVYEYVGNHREIIGERKGLHHAYNELVKIATGPIYMGTSDDVICLTANWDNMVNVAFDQYPDKILFVYPHTHRCSHRFGAVGFVHKDWIDTVGYWFHPDLTNRGDCWINHVADRLNRKFYIGEMDTYHIKLNDKTHLDYLKLNEDAKCYEKYHSREMYKARQGDVRLLSEFIANFKP